MAIHGKLPISATLLLILSATVAIQAQQPVLELQFGPDLSPAIRSRFLQLLTLANQNKYSISVNSTDPTALPAGSVVIALGKVALGNTVIPPATLAGLPAETFVVASKIFGSTFVIAGAGNPPNPSTNPLYGPVASLPNNGLNYATYYILEQLGFGFMHPLDVVVPPGLSIVPSAFADATESPRWPVRGWHMHTEHPLEWTLLMQGWGPAGPYDEAGWNKILPEFTGVIEWHVANRVNALEIVLLAAYDWRKFADSPLRQQRYQQLAAIASQWGVAFGSDTPIAEQQQHGWFMVDPLYPYGEQLKQIAKRIDWLNAAEFTFFSTESGFSEFTHPNCTTMLAWMNYATEYAKQTYNKKLSIKAHISTGQFCPEFADPVTGVPPCNFNFLPHWATPDLGVMPHTVQLYRFDDPAPTYGQENFTAMYKYNMIEAASGRFTLYFGESAYWVNYDVDVPLFLPLYGEARLYDLRLIAAAETTNGRPMSGTFNFESGWEWSYWLGNTITARSGWDPAMEESTLEGAYRKLLRQFTRHFSPSDAQAWSDWIVNVTKAERELFVLGKVNGVSPASVIKLNGMAYLEGWDTWATLGIAINPDVSTQPDALSIDEMFLAANQPFYTQKVRPLLQAMSDTLGPLAQTAQHLAGTAPSQMASLVADLVDSMQITSLRADFVLAIYDSLWQSQSQSWRHHRLLNSVDLLQQVSTVVQRRTAHYRVDVERIAGWFYNPTTYNYGYIWTVNSLYYFYRDIWRAVQPTTETISPCFMNIISPVDVALGEGYILNATEALRAWLEKQGYGSVGDCLYHPVEAPQYTLPPIPSFVTKDNFLGRRSKQNKRN